MASCLLAIDVGRIAGFAYGDVIDPRPAEIGHVRLPTSSVRDLLGARMDAFLKWLGETALHPRPTMIVMAERFRSRTMGEAATNLALDGLVRLHAYRAGIPVLCQPEGTVRKEMLGRGSGSTEQMKRLALAWCERQNLTISNDHEADACVLWAWAARELVATAAATTTSSGQRSGKQPHMGAKKQRNNVAQKTVPARLKAVATQV